MKKFCSQCKRLRPVYYTVTVDDVPHHFCEGCQRSQKAAFMVKLAQGDPKATELMKRIEQIVRGEE